MTEEEKLIKRIDMFTERKEERERNMTNEEWFCSLPLIEKSDWLADFCKFIIESTEGGNDVKWATTKTYWDVWLKAVHKE